MTDNLTLEQITTAQANELDAVTAVINATESRVAKLADKAARRMASGGPRYEDYREEFAQTGRIAVWEALGRFQPGTVDGFFAFIYKTVENALMDAVREERNGAAGADKDAIKVFGEMLAMADGDVFLAEKMAQTVPPKGKRLSADRANAARMAWQGTESLDAPPALEANRDRQYSASTGGNNVMSIAEMIAGSIGIPEELITAEDLNREESRIKHAVVTSILDVMGDGQRVVIKHSFGIGGYTFYGHGASGDDEGLADEIDSTVLKVRDARTKGLKSFAKKYVKTVEASDPGYAAELTEAAALNLSRGGRK
ncbi:sigma factor [Streptomyces chattanoogensis]|uniref:sigma factor n=1 Tax=Streptomyces chattanoogensis TaxID=66876 RepID=UPI00367F7447